MVTIITNQEEIRRLLYADWHTMRFHALALHDTLPLACLVATRWGHDAPCAVLMRRLSSLGDTFGSDPYTAESHEEAVAAGHCMLLAAEWLRGHLEETCRS